jgi:hypothetical protein
MYQVLQNSPAGKGTSSQPSTGRSALSDQHDRLAVLSAIRLSHGVFQNSRQSLDIPNAPSALPSRLDTPSTLHSPNTSDIHLGHLNTSTHRVHNPTTPGTHSYLPSNLISNVNSHNTSHTSSKTVGDITSASIALLPIHTLLTDIAVARWMWWPRRVRWCGRHRWKHHAEHVKGRLYDALVLQIFTPSRYRLGKCLFTCLFFSPQR